MRARGGAAARRRHLARRAGHDAGDARRARARHRHRRRASGRSGSGTARPSSATRDAGDDGQRWLRPDAHGLYAVGAFASVGSYDWTWAEVTPPGRAGDVSAAMIVGLLDGARREHLADRESDQGEGGDPASSRRRCTRPRTRAVRERICHLLAGRRRGDGALAIPALLELLREPRRGTAQRSGRRDHADHGARGKQRRARRGAGCRRRRADGARERERRACARVARRRARGAPARAVDPAARHAARRRRLAGTARGGVVARRRCERPSRSCHCSERSLQESDAHSAEAMRAALAAITGKTLFALSPAGDTRVSQAQVEVETRARASSRLPVRPAKQVARRAARRQIGCLETGPVKALAGADSRGFS